MSNHSSKLHKSAPPKSAVSTSKLLHPSALKVDQRSAMEFSDLINRHGERETSLERQREIHASLDKSADQVRITSQINKTSVQAASSTPSLFFQTQARSRHSLIEEAINEKPQAVGGQTISSEVAGLPAVLPVQHDNSRPAVERIVEAVYRNWQTQSDSVGSQHWAIQLSTGSSVTSELEIEFTAQGEWRLKISDEAKSSSSSNSQEAVSEVLSQAWDHHQFCIELEACLKENLPELGFSTPTRS